MFLIIEPSLELNDCTQQECYVLLIIEPPLQPLLIHLCEFYVSVCICHIYLCALGDQKGMLDPMELELQLTVSSLTGVFRTKLESSERTVGTVNRSAIYPAIGSGFSYQLPGKQDGCCVG